MTDLTEKLPPELLEQILGHAPATDILRAKQVNHRFRCAVLESPLIQHKINLFAAGFEDNVAAGLSLVEKRRALGRYRSNLDSLCPTEERRVNLCVPDDLKTIGGVYAIAGESVRLFAPGSVSRGIPHKEWEIPLTGIDLRSCGFYPDADIIAFAEIREATDMQIAIHLRALSDGGYHPAARYPTIRYSRRGLEAREIPFVSIASSKLAVLTRVQRGVSMVIWNWKSAEVLFVLGNNRYYTVEFIDDHRLLVSLGSETDKPPCIALVDTKKDIEKVPVQTLFHLPSHFRGIEDPPVLLERGAHKPSPAEYLAPFHRDPTQRIVALNVPSPFGYLVFRLEALLGLVEGHEGRDIPWDEWKDHVAFLSLPQSNIVGAWVSGSRLFSVTSTGYSPDARMEVYDFTVQGRAKYLSEQTNADLGGVRHLSPTRVVVVPWAVDKLLDTNGCHDSIAFFGIPDDSTEDESETRGGVLHIWRF